MSNQTTEQQCREVDAIAQALQSKFTTNDYPEIGQNVLRNMAHTAWAFNQRGEAGMVYYFVGSPECCFVPSDRVNHPKYRLVGHPLGERVASGPNRLSFYIEHQLDDVTTDICVFVLDAPSELINTTEVENDQ